MRHWIKHQETHLEGMPSVVLTDIFRHKTEVSSPTDAPSASVLPFAFCVRDERNPYFTGRDDLLERLAKDFSSMAPKRYNRRISLHGLGGVGKTQVALEYVYKHKSDYNYIFWISAVDQARLLA